VLKNQLSEIGLHEKCTYCKNGQEVIDRAKAIVDEATKLAEPDEIIKPIDFILLDHQMPKKNGIQAFQELTEFYKHLNLTQDF